MTGSARSLPLSGVKVLDISSVVMGPYATQILADFGAEVITIEEPGGGLNREMGAGKSPEFSGVSLNLLRNKRMVCLDLKQPAAREAALRIAADCDVVVTNLRPKPLARLGLSYEDVKKVRGDIIFCQAQGFRTDQARADDPAYDDIIQAESGVADAARQVTGTPQIAPTIMADKVCGMAIVNAVLAALFQRERTGEGRRVEVPMADVMRAFVLVEHGAGAISDDDEPAGYRRVLNSERGPQKTADGWINILPYSSAAYDALFGEHGRPDMVGSPMTRGRAMMRHAKALYAMLRPIIATRTTEDWMQFCARHGIPAGRVATLDEMVAALPKADHPVVGPWRVIPAPIWFSGAQSRPVTPAGRVGEETLAVLREAGFAPDQIEAMIESGAALTPSAPAPSATGGGDG